MQGRTHEGMGTPHCGVAGSFFSARCAAERPTWQDNIGPSVHKLGADYRLAGPGMIGGYALKFPPWCAYGVHGSRAKQQRIELNQVFLQMHMMGNHRESRARVGVRWH